MKHPTLRRMIVICMSLLFACLLISCAHEHAFGAWQTTEEATCAAAGERQRTCACGEIEKEEIPALAHTERTLVTTKPTCTEEGEATVVCSVCLGTLRTEPVGMAQHEEERVIVTAPTCKTAGTAQIRCRVCEATLRTAIEPAVQHEQLPYTYNADATPLTDGTATVQCPHCDYTDTKTLVGSAERIREAFEGKTVSVLGDSISTYPGITSGHKASQTYHSSLRGNTPWNGYGGNAEMGVLSSDLTWWGKTASALGLELLVNISECGESIRKAANGRSLQLCPDVGENKGKSPDFIFLFLGTNDFSGVGANVGSVSALTDTQIKILASNADYQPKSVAEAYCVMLYRMKELYPDAKIYCLNVLERPNVDQSALATFNAELSRAVARFDGVTLVDIAADSGIHDDESYRTFVPSNGGTNDVHLGVNGMLAVSRCLQQVILEEYGVLAADESQK